MDLIKRNTPAGTWNCSCLIRMRSMDVIEITGEKTRKRNFFLLECSSYCQLCFNEIHLHECNKALRIFTHICVAPECNAYINLHVAGNLKIEIIISNRVTPVNVTMKVIESTIYHNCFVFCHILFSIANSIIRYYTRVCPSVMLSKVCVKNITSCWNGEWICIIRHRRWLLFIYVLAKNTIGQAFSTAVVDNVLFANK